VNLGDLFSANGIGLGMVALFNPCGFALLPAYLGLFLGTNDDVEESTLRTLNRAQLVGLALTAGFMVVFGIVGVVFAGLMGAIAHWLGWFTLALGIALHILGIAMLAGFEPKISGLKLNKGTDSNSMFSMFLFGISYAVASLSCTIGIFLSVVGTSATVVNDPETGLEIQRTFFEVFLTRMGGFLSYGIGMGLMASVLTLAVGLGKKGIVNGFRQILPKINVISAILLVYIGAYVAYYGYWETNPTPGDPIVDNVLGVQSAISNAISSVALPVGILFVLVNIGLVIAGFIARQNRASETDTESSFFDDEYDDGVPFRNGSPGDDPIARSNTGSYNTANLNAVPGGYNNQAYYSNDQGYSNDKWGDDSYSQEGYGAWDQSNGSMSANDYDSSPDSYGHYGSHGNGSANGDSQQGYGANSGYNPPAGNGRFYEQHQDETTTSLHQNGLNGARQAGGNGRQATSNDSNANGRPTPPAKQPAAPRQADLGNGEYDYRGPESHPRR